MSFLLSIFLPVQTGIIAGSKSRHLVSLKTNVELCDLDLQPSLWFSTFSDMLTLMLALLFHYFNFYLHLTHILPLDSRINGDFH